MVLEHVMFIGNQNQNPVIHPACTVEDPIPCLNCPGLSILTKNGKTTGEFDEIYRKASRYRCNVALRF